jgi:hypothetical protein
MEDQDKKASSTEDVSEEDRYKYIGFDIYPGQIWRRSAEGSRPHPFWKENTV